MIVQKGGSYSTLAAYNSGEKTTRRLIIRVSDKHSVRRIQRDYYTQTPAYTVHAIQMKQPKRHKGNSSKILRSTTDIVMSLIYRSTKYTRKEFIPFSFLVGRCTLRVQFWFRTEVQHSSRQVNTSLQIMLYICGLNCASEDRVLCCTCEICRLELPFVRSIQDFVGEEISEERPVAAHAGRQCSLT